MTAYSVTAKPIRAKSRVRGRVSVLGAVSSYVHAHRRVRRVRGKAIQYICVDCQESFADQWSYVHGSAHEQSGLRLLHQPGKPVRMVWSVWSSNIWDFQPRCRPCHRRYDHAQRSAAS